MWNELQERNEWNKITYDPSIQLLQSKCAFVLELVSASVYIFNNESLVS
jgi:hypothetical protein